MPEKKIILAYPHGFCSGVSRAVQAMGEALRRYAHPVYCYHEVVHNRQVVEGLRRRGAVFVRDMAEVPEGAALLFSAHGVAPSVRECARRKQLRVIDATCPFVARAHAKVKRLTAEGCGVLLIGHRRHEEVEGVAAAGGAGAQVQVIENEDEARAVRPPDPARVGVVTQTTLSVSFVNQMIALLRQRFPQLIAPQKGDICYATQNRQRAAAALARVCDCVWVLGSENSSNSRRLVEIARAEGRQAVLLDSVERLDEIDLAGVRTLGLTSGASTPEDYLEQVLAILRGRGFAAGEKLRLVRENASGFAPPRFPDEACGGRGPL
jgi:4-hydroxy-3-methylbut-2-en-1-yl diphosphate reductase